MPNLIFLGIENPLGVLGQKIRGVITEKDQLQPIESVEKNAWNVSKYAKSLIPKYDNRAKNIPEEAQQILVKDTVDNRKYMLELLKNKGAHPEVRLAMCSSLNSLMKYLDNYAVSNPADKFDTVIIFGHGAKGSVNMGLGPIGIGPYLPVKHEDHQSRKEMRYAFGLDKWTDGETPAPRRIRDLSIENTNVWTGAFANIVNHVDVNDETGCFHLFLMGCDVGVETQEKSHELQDTTLQGAAAKVLSGILQQPVCISAPTKTINTGHLDHLLKKIKKIRQACASGKNNVVVKNEGGDPVSLVSRTS
jgi:hypothetical protein